MSFALDRLTNRVDVSGLLVLGFVGGYGLQPRLQALHRTMYGPGPTLELREEARQKFKTLHGVSQVLNLVVMGGVLVYLWRVTTPSSTYRFHK